MREPIDEPASDERLVASWHINAAAWTRAVREQQIESRRLVTDAAIVEAVLRCAHRSALDLGCGEGWLSRALAAHGVQMVGVDAVPELVEAARAAGGGDFRVLSYEKLAAGGLEAAGRQGANGRDDRRPPETQAGRASMARERPVNGL